MNEMARYFDGRAEEWERNFSRPSPVQGAVAAIAGIRPGTRVLDLGCGTGVMMDIYLGLNVAAVVALDIAPRMIAIARQKFAQQERIDFRCCDALQFSDPQGFDALVIYNAYPHFLDKPALVAKAIQLLRPHGRFVVAHSMGRKKMNAHHSYVPPSVTSTLHPPSIAAEAWRPWFTIDTLVDSPGFYCFAGEVVSTTREDD